MGVAFNGDYELTQISNKNNITKEDEYALDAIQNNPSINGTLANRVKELEEENARLTDSLCIINSGVLSGTEISNSANDVNITFTNPFKDTDYNIICSCENSQNYNTFSYYVKNKTSLTCTIAARFDATSTDRSVRWSAIGF